MRIAEHIGTERQKIPRIKVLIDERHIQPVSVAVRFLPDLTAIGVQVVHGLHHVRNAVFVVVPFAFPVLGQKISAVGEHGGLLRDGHAVIELEPVCLQLVDVHDRLRNVCDIQLLRGKGQDMPALGIAHEHVVRLIEHVGAVSVRPVLLEVDILIHIGVDGVDVVRGIAFVEGVQHFLQMPRFDRHLIVEHANGGVLLDLAVELRHEFLIGERTPPRTLRTGGKRAHGERQGKRNTNDFPLFHADSSLSITT